MTILQSLHDWLFGHHEAVDIIMRAVEPFVADLEAELFEARRQVAELSTRLAEVENG